MEGYLAVSVWPVTTLVPNFIVAWKRGRWYWRGTGLHAGRWWAALIWLLWIITANFLIYPMVEQGVTRLYFLVGEEKALPVFFATVAVWIYAFIWKGERIGAV